MIDSEITKRLNSLYKQRLFVITLSILFIVLILASMMSPIHRWGDTSTYYMEIQSISDDFNIQYEEKDIHRALDHGFDDLPSGLYLIKTANQKYFYGKEFSYPLFAASFYKIFGNNGLIFFNMLMFYLMILMAYLYLRRTNSESIALGFSILFFMLSTAFVYTFWIHAEIYNMFLLMLGLVSWLKYREDNDIRYLAFASLVLSVATVAKIPNIVLFLPLLSFELYERHRKNATIMLLAFAIPVALFYGYFYIRTGAFSFYGGDRLYYVHAFPFTSGYNSTTEAGNTAFSVEGSSFYQMINIHNLRIIPYNLFYYFFGRFTGMIWYYPFAFFAMLTFIINYRKTKDYISLYPEKMLILAGIVLNIALYIAIIGNNYFGGQQVMGNRYFYIYPAFLFLLGKIDVRKAAIFLMIAIITVIPIVSNPVGNSMSPEEHTFNFPYKYLPLEYGQLINLPLESRRLGINGLNFYCMDANCTVSNKVIGVEKSSELLIVSRHAVKTFNFLLLSQFGHNLIYINMNNYTSNLTLNKSGLKSLTVSNSYPIYEDQRSSVYRLFLNANKNFYLIPIVEENFDELKPELAYGWYKKDVTQWMTNYSALVLYSNKNCFANLSLQARSFYRSRTLEIYSGDVRMAKSTVPSDFINLSVPIFLSKGFNVMYFNVPDGCEKPIDKLELQSSDPRCLSLAIRNVTLALSLNERKRKSAVEYSSDFYDPENWSGRTTRWMKNNASFFIYSDRNCTALLSLNALSYNSSRTLVVSSENSQTARMTIPTDLVDVSGLVNLNRGANVINLSVLEACERPIDTPNLRNYDQRCLSLAIQNISWQEVN